MRMFAAIASHGWSVEDAKSYLKRYAAAKGFEITKWKTENLGQGCIWVEGRA